MTRYCTEYGAYEIDSVPGQPQLAHCHGFFVAPEHRGKGLGHFLKQEQMQMLASLRYDAATCTVDGSNTAQKRVLESAGWVKAGVFTNSKTGSVTELWMIRLEPKNADSNKAERAT